MLTNEAAKRLDLAKDVFQSLGVDVSFKGGKYIQAEMRYGKVGRFVRLNLTYEMANNAKFDICSWLIGKYTSDFERSAKVVSAQKVTGSTLEEMETIFSGVTLAAIRDIANKIDNHKMEHHK